MSLNNDLTTKNWTGCVVTRPFCPRQYIELGIAVPHMKDASPAARKFIACAVQLLSAGNSPTMMHPACAGSRFLQNDIMQD